jgi:alpha-galactosidase
MSKMKGRGFTDATLRTEPYRTVSYRSGLTVCEESLIGGMYVASGWNGAGYPLEGAHLKPDMFATPQAFQLEIDGQFLGSHWEWKDFAKKETDKGLEVVVTLRHMVRPVTVKVCTLLDGTPILTRWLEIVNESDAPAAIGKMGPIGGGLQSTPRWKEHLQPGVELYELGYMENTQWGSEGDFQWHALPNAGYSVYGRFRRERHRHPIFVLKNQATGECFICQFAWSAGYVFEFQLDTDYSHFVNRGANLGYLVAMDAPAPLRMMEPHETVKTPTVHIGMLFGGLDEAVQAMHMHLRRSFMSPQARGRGCWVETGAGATEAEPREGMTMAYTYRMIEDAAFMGVEVFFFDAGWYVPPKVTGADWWDHVGDWYWDKTRFKEGVKPIRDRVREKGMLFGLWMDSERIGKLSQAAKDHPDWIATNYTGAKNKLNMLDLTNPAAAKWMEDEIARVIEDNECDFYRLDYNVCGVYDGISDGISCSVEDDLVVNNYWKYYDVLYAIYERLRARFPDVIFENCASGGGRTDIGIVSRFNHTWISDWMAPPRNFRITSGMSIALPPEYIDRCIGNFPGSLQFQARLLLFARPTIGQLYSIGAEMNPGQMGIVRHMIELYKDFVRPFQPESRIYHHTPVMPGIEPRGTGILELAADDASRGILGVFQLSNPDSPETVVRFRGVDVAKRYRVTWDNRGSTVVLDGLRLVEEGLRFRLDGALTSELILYEEVAAEVFAD